MKPRPSRTFHLWLFLAISLFLTQGTSLLAGTLQVELPREVLGAGCKIRLYAWNTSGPFPRVVREQDVSNQLSFEFEVENGDYGIEVAGVVKSNLVALRKSRFKVEAKTGLTLAAAEQTAEATIDGQAVPSLQQFAVRRLGVGEERWQAEDGKGEAGGRPPMLLLTPDEKYFVSCVASRQKTTLAVWQTSTGTAGQAITFSDQYARCEVSAQPATDAPPLQRAEMRIVFPDATVVVRDILGGGRLLTNRERASVLFEYATQADERIKLIPRIERFTAKTQLTFGGPLKPFVFADVIPRRKKFEVDEWENELVTRVYFSDPPNRSVDLMQSSFGFKGRWTFGRKSFLNGDPSVMPVDADRFKPKQARATFSYSYGGKPYTFTREAIGYSSVTSPHFLAKAPPGLEDRVRLLLQIAEVNRLATQKACGRPGPAFTNIKWIYNNDMAFGTISAVEGGKSDVWMHLPFEDLELLTDPFSEPRFLVHEHLHNFGYQHGDEMNQFQAKLLDTFSDRRWIAVDTGEWPVGTELHSGEKSKVATPARKG